MAYEEKISRTISTKKICWLKLTNI